MLKSVLLHITEPIFFHNWRMKVFHLSPAYNRTCCLSLHDLCHLLKSNHNLSKPPRDLTRFFPTTLFLSCIQMFWINLFIQIKHKLTRHFYAIFQNSTQTCLFERNITVVVATKKITCMSHKCTTPSMYTWSATRLDQTTGLRHTYS